ncbi:hypothetical protein ACJ41O_010199 [Fusarium nematophilum]
MASDSDNPHAMIALVIEELQRIQKHPRLQDENRSSAKQPDKETFPTYPRRVAPPDLRKAEKLYNLALVHGESRPFAQFKSQAAREITLPWDDRLGYLENAENNVRARWVEQGIWAEEWGPAWSSKNCGIPSDETDSPFHGIESSIEFCSALITRWGHESPTPVIEGTQFGFDNSKPVACLYDPDDQFTRLLMKIHLPPKPVVRNLEASRPYLQFLYQLSKERQWLEDEWHYKPPGTSLDREKAAYESVRDNWMEDSIWNYDWDALPGSRWPYEGLHPVLPRLRLSEHPVREPVQHPEQEPDSAAARNRKRIWAYHIYETALAHPETRPLAQFRKQVDREHRRLLYQRRAQSRGRPQTLPFDPCLTVRKNAENNVRTYWVDQGIWEERWGPAWEAGPNPLKVDDDGEVGGDGPFQGRHDPVKAGDWISYITRWGHEEPAPAQEKCPTDGRPRPDPLTYLYLPTCPHGPVSLYYPPRPFVQYPDASRPHRQYVYQVRKESEWIRDEWWEGKQSSYIFETPPSDPIGKAFEDVKKQWIDDGIWNSAWDTVPGSTWAHEGLYPLASWYPHAGDHSLKHSRESGSLFFGSFGMRRDGNKDMERVGSERES